MKVDNVEIVKDENLIRAQRDLSLELSSISKLDEALHICLETAIQISGMDSGGIYLVDENSGLQLVTHKGLSNKFIKNVTYFDAESPYTCLVLEGKPVYSRYRSLILFYKYPRCCVDLLAVAIIPMHHEGRVIACLNIVSHTLDEISISARSALETIATQIGNSIARLKAVEAFRASEKRFRELADLLPQTVFEIDEKGNFTFVNTHGFESTGYTQEDINNGVNVLKLFIHEDREMIKENINRGLRGEKISGIEYTLLRKDRNTYPVLIYSSPIIHENKPVGLGGILIDITERKKAEEALQKSEKRYRSLFEESPISLWEEDFSNIKIFIDSLQESGVKDFRAYFNNNPEDVVNCMSMVKIIDVNKAALEMYKARNKEEIFHNLSKIFTAESSFMLESFHLFREWLISLSEGKTSFECEAINQTLNGNKIHITLKWSVAPGFEKTWSKVLVSTIDITDRKKIEEDLRIRAQFLDAVPVSVFLNDLDGNFIYVNKAAYESLNYAKDEFMDINIYNLVTPEYTKHLKLRIKELLKRGKIIFESAHFRRDYSIMPVEIHARIIESDNRKLILSVVHDITVRKRIEEELLRYSKHLEEAFKSSLDSITFTDIKTEARKVIETDFFKSIQKQLKNKNYEK